MGYQLSYTDSRDITYIEAYATLNNVRTNSLKSPHGVIIEFSVFKDKAYYDTLKADMDATDSSHWVGNMQMLVAPNDFLTYFVSDSANYVTEASMAFTDVYKKQIYKYTNAIHKVSGGVFDGATEITEDYI